MSDKLHKILSPLTIRVNLDLFFGSVVENGYADLQSKLGKTCQLIQIQLHVLGV